jgi:hypothetical protein
MGVKGNAYEALVTIPKGSRPLQRCSCKLYSDIEMDLKGIVGKGASLLHSFGPE